VFKKSPPSKTPNPLIRRFSLGTAHAKAGLSLAAVLAVAIGYTIFSTFASTGFVTRSGSQLMFGGQVFRFSGANLYWVGLDDNIRDGSGNPTYPTHYRIDNGFDAAVATHATVARTHTVGISIGCSVCLEPTSGQFNDAAFESMDYAVQSAGKHGIKLQIPLIDQWRYYHGGKWNFVHWAAQAGVPGVIDTKSDMTRNAGNDSGSASSEKNIEEQFYSNPTIIANYQAYLNHLLNHVNQYTGVALKDDPTVIDWETGNELFDAPTSWTSMMATYLKSTIGVKQLVADGSAASGNHVSNADLGDPNIDIVAGHFYAYPSGLDTSWMNADAQLAHNNNKVYEVGEYAWTRSERPAFLSAIESNPNISGDMLWAILPRKEDGTPEAHGSNNFGDDDVPLYYPTTSSQMQTAFTQLVTHAQVMSGNAPTPTPTPVPTAAPTPTPLPTPAGSTLINDATTAGSPAFSYAGSWSTSTGVGKYNGDDHYTSSGGDTATLSFTGTRAQIYGAKAPHHGIASLKVDNGTASPVDMYSATRSDQDLMFDTGVLPAGGHIVTIQDSGTKNSSSTSTVITVDLAAVVVSIGTPAPTATPTPTTQPTTAPTPSPTPAPLIADINHDGHVNIFDLSILLAKWLTNDATADLNHDGVVNVFDLSILLAHWTG
jgi:hypothetical protein